MGRRISEEAHVAEAAPDTSLRFAGQWADEESGLHYNLNRYYDPDSGCYLSIDPIAIRGGHRTQGYVQNPLREMDPLGLAVCPERYDRYKQLRAEGYSAADAARSCRRRQQKTGPCLRHREAEKAQVVTQRGDENMALKKASQNLIGVGWYGATRAILRLTWSTRHGHHAVFKKGRGAKMRSIWTRSKDVLENYDIDWYRGAGEI
ncbi:RHS repeat-associated core domain-containing protein [Cupriavidus basilensis]